MKVDITSGQSATISGEGVLSIQNLGPGVLLLAKESSDTDGVQVAVDGWYELPRRLADSDGDNTLHLTASGGDCEVRYLEF